VDTAGSEQKWIRSNISKAKEDKGLRVGPRRGLDDARTPETGSAPSGSNLKTICLGLDATNNALMETGEPVRCTSQRLDRPVVG